MTGTTWLIIVVVVAFAVGAYIDVKMFRRVSLRVKLILTFVPVLLLAVALLAIITNNSVRAKLTTAANQSLLTAATESVNRIDTFFITTQEAMRTEAELPDFVALLDSNYFRPDFGNQTDVLRSLSKKDTEHVLSYGVLNNAGLNIADSVSRNVGKDESDRTYFHAAETSRLPYASPVFFEGADSAPVFYISTPVFGVDDQIVGVLRVKYDAKILQDLIESSAGKAGPGSFAVLFNENNLHLAHGVADIAPTADYKLLVPPTNMDWLQRKQNAHRLPPGAPEDISMNLPELEEKMKSAQADPFFTAEDVATGNKIDQVAVRRMTSQPWSVAFFQPREIFLAPIASQQRRMLILAVTIGLGALIASVWLGQVLSNPIIRLTGVAEQVTAGHLDVLAPVEGRDEIAQLAKVFNNMTAQLRQFIGSLEEQVKARTAELTLSMQVGQRAAAIREENKLLPTITEFIRNQFNLYYVQVYYVDDLQQNLVLRQGTGNVGKELLARRHHLPIGEGSIVGQVAATGESIVVSNTELSDIHKPNPLLPATRSELAVPLMVEEKVIGVLDMQGSQAHTFMQDNVTVFEAMATQLAIAIDSARQWSAAQAAQLQAERTLHRQTREAWSEVLEGEHQQRLGFSYNLSGITPLHEQTPASVAAPTVSVPLLVQEQQLGSLSLTLTEGQQPADARIILQAVAQQLSQKIENLRLFDNTQRHAWRDKMVSETTTSVWSTTDVESVMKVTVAELGETLNASEVVIRLGGDMAWLEALDAPARNEPESDANGASLVE